jgi:cyclase
MYADFTTKISPPNTALPAREAWPTVTFSRDVTLRLGDEEILVRHPETDGAHTNGDSFVYFRRANVLATGDIMFNGMYPSIDTAEGGWAHGIAASCREAAALIDDNTVVIPGHGKITNKQSLLHYADMLDDISRNVGDLAAKGMTLDEIIASHPTAKWDAEFGKSILPPPFAIAPDYFAQCVYNGIISHKQAAK